MPKEWLTELYKACIHLDYELILELIKQIPENQFLLANKNYHLVGNYQIKMLIKILQESGENHRKIYSL